jgi:hypothetical protein
MMLGKGKTPLLLKHRFRDEPFFSPFPSGLLYSNRLFAFPWGIFDRETEWEFLVALLRNPGCWLLPHRERERGGLLFQGLRPTPITEKHACNAPRRLFRGWSEAGHSRLGNGHVGFLPGFFFFFHPQDFCFAKVTTEGRDDTDRGISTTAGARDGTDQRWQGKANPGIGLPRQGWFRDATTRRDVSQGPSWGSLTVLWRRGVCFGFWWLLQLLSASPTFRQDKQILEMVNMFCADFSSRAFQPSMN